jgi:hypothetical protein
MASPYQEATASGTGPHRRPSENRTARDRPGLPRLLFAVAVLLPILCANVHHTPRQHLIQSIAQAAGRHGNIHAMRKLPFRSKLGPVMHSGHACMTVSDSLKHKPRPGRPGLGSNRSTAGKGVQARLRNSNPAAGEGFQSGGPPVGRFARLAWVISCFQERDLEVSLSEEVPKFLGLLAQLFDDRTSGHHIWRFPIFIHNARNTGGYGRFLTYNFITVRVCHA